MVISKYKINNEIDCKFIDVLLACVQMNRGLSH